VEGYRSTYREESGTQVAVTFIPMKPNAPSPTNPDARLASSNAVVGGFVLTAQRLKERIKEKAGGRCDIAGIPYAVVAGIHDFPDGEEILAGLCGRTCPEGRGNSGGEHRQVRIRKPHRPRNPAPAVAGTAVALHHAVRALRAQPSTKAAL
jgi:hypothetical protein